MKTTGQPVPAWYLDAVIAGMEARGRDFGRDELTMGEQLALVGHFRSGFTAEETAALLCGEKVTPRTGGGEAA